ncbi:uncharacterized protein PADG_00594 [Paracoccidioides brasiliensis Pb18]|uniref:Chromatin structure-remodeling complex protein RSC7 n=1 Tax=Paracoccidioides brasiliensis (strain Pb18) TaxID=502780 RepID=C1G154_PARBD|nr:uncharacterized protein PADG_00594 [Paracoccidioides brasiliensis Pb18]EEH44305.1 hypothetical protein PADG_00594 [Paracoccidioides brasiliensis Pb18]ODH53484.1 hypothetical protein GX48_00315 [Paracoccidioides brasiliensis]
MARKQRAAAQAAAQSLRAAPQPLEEEMVDAASNATSPRDDDGNAPDKRDDTPAAEEYEAGSQTERQAEESERPSSVAPDTPIKTGRVSAIPRKRGGRVGRPPKIRPPVTDDGNGETRSEVTTPVKRRGRGRPSAGGRWGRAKGGPSHVTQVPIDKEGNMMDVVNDEVDLPEDPEGETKVDKLGNLLGGREYRVRTFTILNKGERLYMLSTEPARCIGFRDSYLFFQKHKLLFKIIIDDDAKRDLIERELIPHSYKGRAIGVVTARSVFREFGAKIIIGGRKVIDDYSAQAARERGDVEGELAVPEDKLPGPGETYDKNRYVAWHGASSVYHSGVPSVPMPMGKITDPKKRKVVITNDNWMIEHSREASRFNSSILATRRENLNGQYDIHTNTMLYPRIMQPTHFRWEVVPPPETSQANRSELFRSASTAALGLSKDTPATPAGNASKPPNGHSVKAEKDKPARKNASTIFPPVPAVFSRKFEIHDILYESPPDSTLSRPGPDGDSQDIGQNGLITLSTGRYNPMFQMSPEILAQLPPDCKVAYREAAVREWEWKRRWGTETEDASRAPMGYNYAWTP